MAIAGPWCEPGLCPICKRIQDSSGSDGGLILLHGSIEYTRSGQGSGSIIT